MTRRAIGRIVEWTGRLVLGGLFLYAGYTKVRSPFLFEMAVDSYRLLSPGLVVFVARTLPWFEVILGLLLLSGWKLRYVSIAPPLLLGGFLVSMAIAYARGTEANCGCFSMEERISPVTLTRDSLLFLLSVGLTVAAIWRRRSGTAAAVLSGSE